MGGSYPLLATMKEAPTTEYSPPCPDPPWAGGAGLTEGSGPAEAAVAAAGRLNMGCGGAVDDGWNGDRTMLRGRKAVGRLGAGLTPAWSLDDLRGATAMGCGHLRAATAAT